MHLEPPAKIDSEAVIDEVTKLLEKHIEKQWAARPGGTYENTIYVCPIHMQLPPELADQRWKVDQGWDKIWASVVLPEGFWFGRGGVEGNISYLGETWVTYGRPPKDSCLRTFSYWDADAGHQCKPPPKATEKSWWQRLLSYLK